ncbi:hypothetical protein ACFL28_05570, partial [Candidatus Omnitrophota bacterium]
VSTGIGTTEVKLEYTLNDSDWVTIITNRTNNGNGVAVNSYPWGPSSPGPLPTNIATLNAKIRISGSDPVQPVALYPEIETAVFALCGDLTISEPTGNTTWIADGEADKTISWSVYGKVDNVRIDYTRGGTGSWTTIVPSYNAEFDTNNTSSTTANFGSYDWTLPTTPTSGDYITRFNTDGKGSLVAIFDQDSNYETWVTSESQGFIVKGQLTILKPADVSGGLNCGDLQTIEWQRDGRINAVNVKYSINGGSNYPNFIGSADREFADDIVATQTTASQWSVPEAPMVTGYRILVEDTEYEKDSEAGTFAETDPFRVIGGLELTAPLATDVWRLTEERTISWKVKHGNMTYVKIWASPLGDFSDEYSITGATTIDAFSVGDPFDTDNLSDRVGSGFYEWTIPETAALVDTMKFKIVQADSGFTDIESTNTSAAMDMRARITVQTPTVDFDNGLDWKYGETNRQVKFTPYGTNLNTVYIYLYDGSAEYNLAPGGVSTSGDGNVQTETGITVPDIKSHDCVIRVRDNETRQTSLDSGVEGVSSGTFSAYPVISSVAITPTPPHSQAGVWIAESTNQTVTWSVGGSTKISSVDILYSAAGEAGLADYEPGVTTSESCSTITVPTARTIDALIRVQDTNANFEDDIQDDSGQFKVYGKTWINQPKTGADVIYPVGATDQIIKWDYDGNITAVNIDVDYNYP